MLKLTIPGRELYDESTQTITEAKPITLKLVHSLVSISKWEAKWEMAFLGHEDKSMAQMLDYIRMMTITQNVPDEVFNNLPQSTIDEIGAYINAPMTATKFRERKGRANREIITSEIIYYWMVHFNIPFECQKWHLNRLLTLVKVCSEKQAPKKKMSRAEILNQQRKLNEERRAKLNTKG